MLCFIDTSATRRVRRSTDETMTPEYLQAIAALLSAVAWPLVIVVFILTQRRPLIGLLDKLEEITFPGGFGAKLRREVDKSAEAALSSDPRAGKAPTEEQLEAAERVEQVARRSDISVVWAEVRQLAREYERIRATMPSGDSRTRRMEVVVTKMRTLALAAYPLLRDLDSSESPGERLAAVAILQVRPNPDYLDWLAERVAEEKPFIGYHAAVALLVAARTLESSHHAELQAAVQKARKSVGWRLKDTDRDRVLSDAENELEEKPAGPEAL